MFPGVARNQRVTLVATYLNWSLMPRSEVCHGL